MTSHAPFAITCKCPHCLRDAKHVMVPSLEETLAWCQHCGRVHFLPMQVQAPVTELRSAAGFSLA